jgi:hypothetical protein
MGSLIEELRRREAAAQGGNARGAPSRARGSKANGVARRSARAGHRGRKPLHCPVTPCAYAVTHAIDVRGRCGGLPGDGVHCYPGRGTRRQQQARDVQRAVRDAGTAR